MPYEIRLLNPVLKDIQDMRKRRQHFDKQFLKTLLQLSENPNHPGLHVHALNGYPEWKEAYINEADRLIFTVRENKIVVCWCGDHTDLDQQVFAHTLHNVDKELVK